MKRRALTTREHFEYWLFDMDDALERFLARMPPESRTKLDYSPRSLDILEAWILDAYPDVAAMRDPEQAHTVDGVARYIGETFRKTIGGIWDINLDEPQKAFFGVPILIGFEERPTPVCPLALAHATADRRKGNFLRTVLENIMRGSEP